MLCNKCVVLLSVSIQKVFGSCVVLYVLSVVCYVTSVLCYSHGVSRNHAGVALCYMCYVWCVV